MPCTMVSMTTFAFRTFGRRGLRAKARGELVHEARLVVLPPQVVGPLGQERLGVHRGLLDARSRVGLDLGEERPAVAGELERLRLPLLADAHHDAPGGADGVGHPLPGLAETPAQLFALKGVHAVPGELRPHVLPAEQRAHRVARGGEAVAGRRRQHHHVAVHAGPVRPGGLGEVSARHRARLAGVRRRLRAEHRVAELAVVGEVGGRLRQGV